MSRDESLWRIVVLCVTDQNGIEKKKNMGESRVEGFCTCTIKEEEGE